MISAKSFVRARVLGLLVCAIAALTFLGCASLRHKIVYTPAPPLPSYYDLQRGVPIRRVAMLPLCYEQEIGRDSSDLDTSFHAELTKTTLFEVVWISRSQLETMVGRRQISSVETVPTELFSQLASQFGVDAVLFTDVTHYFPYQPIAVGVRCKLADIHNGEIRWAFDHLFDSGKPSVAVAARHFYLTNSQTNLPICNDGSSVLQSPLRFSGYAAWETYRSLINKPCPAADDSADVSKVVLNSVK